MRIPNSDEGTARTLPTDETGKYIYPVVDADGMLLPRNSEGRYMTAEGELIPVDDFGRPLDQEIAPEGEGIWMFDYGKKNWNISFRNIIELTENS